MPSVWCATTCAARLAYLKQNQGEYYRRLSAVRTDADWEGRTAFFLDGVETAATDAERGIVAIASPVAADRRRMLAAPRVGAVGLRLFELLPLMPRFTIEQARQKLATTFPTATAAVKLLEGLGIVTELTGQRKNRCFSYAGYVELLADGTGRGRERHMAERRAAHPHGFSHAAGLHATICDRTGRVGTSMKTTLDRSLGPADSGCRAGLAVRTGVASFETRRPGTDGTPVHASSRTKARRR